MNIKYRVQKEKGGYSEFLPEEYDEALSFASKNNSTVETIERDDSEPVEVPQVVTPRQFWVALALKGVTEADILAAIVRLPEPNKTIVTIELNKSLEFQRSHPFVPVIGSILGWSENQLDDLWILAATL